MRDLIEKFSIEYEDFISSFMDNEDERSMILSPLLFVFLGDDCAEPLMRIKERINKKWDNSEGVFYLHIYNEQKVQDNIYTLKLNMPKKELKDYRKQIYENFITDREMLKNINDIIRNISNNIAEKGKSYSNCQLVNICFICTTEEPLNIILPDIAVLFKRRLLKNFKQVNSDFIGIMREKYENEDHGYAKAISYGFIKEIEYYQSANFQYSKKIEVLEDIELNVEHQGGNLFDIISILTDKDEKGYLSHENMKKNYDIITNFNLLKNRYARKQSTNNAGKFNTTMFKNNIEGRGYIPWTSMGYYRIKKPNTKIAKTVINYIYEYVYNGLTAYKTIENVEILKLLGLDSKNTEIWSNSIFESIEKTEEMESIMSNNVDYKYLCRKTYKEAEEILYGCNCENFFEKNYEQVGEDYLNKNLIEDTLKKKIDTILGDKNFGFYAMYMWTKENRDHIGPIDLLRQKIKELNISMEKYEQELEGEYNKLVFNDQFLGILFHKKKLRELKRNLFENIYTKKVNICRTKFEIKILKKCEEILENKHKELKEKAEQFHSIKTQLNEMIVEEEGIKNDYLMKNVPQYYKQVIENIMKEMEEKRGDKFYLEDKYIGSIVNYKDKEDIIHRIIDFSKKFILKDRVFSQTFEQEIFNRTNIKIDYDNKDVLSKAELYRKLYTMIIENMGINVYLYDYYTIQNSYEERYIFADCESEFIKYIREMDSDIDCTLSFVDEEKASGIEMLRIKGGFKSSDICSIKNYEELYDTYIQNGYAFHSSDYNLEGRL